MNNKKISPKELRVIDSIYNDSCKSQRDIATDVGLSLGLTNILINRLVKEGYIKVSRLNAKKMSYIITPRGLKEKARKSYGFMKRSLSVINELKKRITDFALAKYAEGKREFLVLGSGELSDITELVLNSLKLEDVSIVKESGKNVRYNDRVVFNTAHNGDSSSDDRMDIWKEAEELYGRNYEI